MSRTVHDRDWVRLLLVAAISTLIAGAAFSAATAMVWPEHWPAWVARVSSGGWFAGMLLAGGGLLIWARRRLDGAAAVACRSAQYQGV